MQCLMIESSAIIREVATRMLAGMGYKTTGVETVGDGVKACRERLPDIVFLDWELADLGAVNFLQFIAEIDAEKRPAVILCVTENDPQKLTPARAAGAYYQLQKPYSRTDVENVLRDCAGADEAAWRSEPPLEAHEAGA